MEKAKHCEQCEEFLVDVVGEEIRCMAGFRPRFYQPRYGAELPMRPINDFGFKRRCRNFAQAHDDDVADNKDSLLILGYSCYRT